MGIFSKTQSFEDEYEEEDVEEIRRKSERRGYSILFRNIETWEWL